MAELGPDEGAGLQEKCQLRHARDMDQEGIGAVAAAAVAALGVPAAVLVGRWQMRAALRAAEETGRAGIAQAEST